MLARSYFCLFAILGEFVRHFFIEIQEEIHRFAGLEGGRRGTKIASKRFVRKLAFSENITSCDLLWQQMSQEESPPHQKRTPQQKQSALTLSIFCAKCPPTNSSV